MSRTELATASMP